jgi:DNA modification methylase
VNRNRDGSDNKNPNGNAYGTYKNMAGADVGYGDSGGASRFFYCAKASRKDRNAGATNTHPTVKPTDVMRWLVRLVTPPGGVVLDPFMGSGSTGRAAVLEGARFVGIELSPEYLAIAEARIAEAAA